MPDVTVVIPTHDRDEFLGEAVESVLGSAPAPGVELAAVIVSDDRGSSRTRHLVESVAASSASPVRYVDSSGPDAGTAGASRNAGAALVTSQFIAFLDDDDTWEPGFLGSTVGAATDAHADFAVAWIRPDDPGYRMARMRPGLAARDVVARNPGFTGSNFVMRTEAFRGLGGFDLALTVSNDKDLLVRALLAGLTYVVVPHELVHYRVHAAGQLTDRTPRRLAGIQRYAAKHRALLSPADRLYLSAQRESVRRGLTTSLVRRSWSLAVIATQRLVDPLLRSRR